MASIIKPNERAQQGVAFQFSDMTDKAKSYLESVQAEAQRIIADAQKEVQAIRQRAEQEGRAAAMAELDRVAEEKVAARVQSLVPALQQVVQQIEQSRQGWLKHWEKQAVHLAGAIAARIARREAQNDPQITVTLVREALELAAGSAQVRVRLNPHDHQVLGDHCQRLAGELGPRDQMEFVADATVTPGGCRVDTQFGMIDQQFEAQLARIEQELV